LLGPVYAFDITTDTHAAQTASAGSHTVAAGVTLTAPAGGPVVNFTGAATLTNSGTISHTGTTANSRAILANTNNAVTIINNPGALITSFGSVADTEVIRLQNTSSAAVYLLDNQGTIWQQGSNENGIRAVRADANFSSTNNRIINGSAFNTAAVIRSNGNDALRLGSNFTLTNYGSIFSTGVVNTSSASGSGQYLNGIATQNYSAADGVAIDDNRTNVAVLNYGAITGPRHGIDGGKHTATDADLTALAQSSITTQNEQLSIDRLVVTATTPNGVTFDRIINNVTTTNVKVTNPVVINYSDGVITGNNGSGVGIDGAGVVINYGTITGNYAGAGNVYKHYTTQSTVLWNGELLSTDTSSNGDGDGVDIDGVAYVENWGVIRGTGAGGYDSGGRPNGADGVAAGGGTIINRSGATIYGQSRGILIDDGASGSLTGGNGRNIPAENISGDVARIHNEGTITGEKKAAVGLVGNFNDLLVNYSTGVITGGGDSVRVDELGSTTPAAAVQMGGGNDVLINYGRIEGKNGMAIDMGAGNDVLKLFNGGSTGVVIGTITGGDGSDTLETGGTHTFEAGTLSGFESFIVRDGTTVFDYGLGSVTFVQVDAGATLQVNGSLSTTGNLTLNGTFRASTDTSMRAISVGGNYTQGAASVLEMGLGAANQSDSINVTGSATIANGATITPLPRAYVNNGASYTLVSANGGLTVTPANLLINDNSALVNYALSSTPNSLVLTATRTSTLANAAPSGHGNVASALDSLGQSGSSAADALLSALDSLPTMQAVSDALKQVSPETNGAAQQASQQAISGVLAALEGRIDAARMGLAIAPSGLAAGDGNHRRFWMQGIGAWGKQDPRSNANGYKLGAAGIIGGIEVDRSARELMGLSVGYTQAGTTGTGAGSGDDVRVGAYHVGGYLSRTDSNMTLDAVLALGYNEYRSERTVVFPGFSEKLTGEYNGWQLGGRVEVGFPFPISSQWSGRWLLGARASHTTTSSYTERGSPAAAQRLDSTSYESLQSALGVELARESPAGSIFQLRARYLRELANPPSVSATFVAGGPNFRTTSVAPGRDALQLGVGYRHVTEGGVSVSLSYDAETRNKFRSHQVNARAVWTF
jgi:uncharacterized protein with beta-barrel porin domain